MGIGGVAVTDLVMCDEISEGLVNDLIGSEELVSDVCDVDQVMFDVGSFALVRQTVAPDFVAQSDDEATSRSTA